MTRVKRLGIWMDHSTAHCMNTATEPYETTIITSDISGKRNESGMNKGEKRMHAIEQNQQSEFYSKLSQLIKNYDEVLLFGPTDAKVELFNSLKSNHHYDAIKIEFENADKMTENQQCAFVRDHFPKR